jgi:branched-chain amino acid transport system substrate-binding protein
MVLMKGQKKMYALLMGLLVMLLVVSGCSNNKPTGEQAGIKKQLEPVKIGIVTSKTGPLEAYGQQMLKGFELGLDYATGGTLEVAGRPIKVVIEDSQTNPEIGRQRAIDLLERDKVDILVGSASSAVALSILPLAEEYQRIMVVEPAVADSITGAQWNKYIFRTGRNSSQDAIAGAAAIAGPGVKIATLAPDYAFGHDGVAAFEKAAQKLGAELILKEFPDPSAADFTANIQRIINAKPDYLFVIWAGANSPWNQIANMRVAEQGITISTGAPDIAALKTMNDLVGMEGFSVYYHKLPNNPVNDWLVAKHLEKFNEPPDLFTAGGMAAAISIVEALKQTNGSADADQLIIAMEGMTFDTPKGPMTFRAEDHQALQTIYAIRLEDTGLGYPEPVLLREMTPDETAPPVQNKR